MLLLADYIEHMDDAELASVLSTIKKQRKELFCELCGTDGAVLPSINRHFRVVTGRDRSLTGKNGE